MQSVAVDIRLFDLFKPSSRVQEALLLVGFNLLLVGSAFVSIHLPFSPVPITAQTFAVLLIAMVLGRTRATAVVMAYLLEGAAGLPVFAGGSGGYLILMGPTGGYLIGFLVSSYLVGWLADKGWDRSLLLSLAAMTFGTVVIFLCGLAQLSIFVPLDGLLSLGLVPFLPGAGIKIALAAVILPSLWRFVDKKR